MRPGKGYAERERRGGERQRTAGETGHFDKKNTVIRAKSTLMHVPSATVSVCGQDVEPLLLFTLTNGKFQFSLISLCIYGNKHII